MNIEKNCVVRLRFAVSEADGAKVEFLDAAEPLACLIGHGALIPGLEASLEGKRAGDTFEVTLAPEQAYGERREGLIQRVPKKYFGERRLMPGQMVILPLREGPRPVTVRKVGMTVVDIDLNHPMAGKTLQYRIEVLEVREASEEEIAHGHVHGPGGHTHD